MGIEIAEKICFLAILLFGIWLFYSHTTEGDDRSWEGRIAAIWITIIGFILVFLSF